MNKDVYIASWFLKQGNSRSSVPTGKSKYAKFKYNLLICFQKQELITIHPTTKVIGQKNFNKN